MSFVFPLPLRPWLTRQIRDGRDWSQKLKPILKGNFSAK